MKKNVFISAVVIIFFVLLLIVVMNFSINNNRGDLAKYQRDIDYLKRQVENVTNNYTSCLALLDITQNELNITRYELDNYQCACPKSRIYDVNRDGKIDFDDVQIVLNFINKKQSKIMLKISGYHLLYDVNCDSVVDMRDAEEIWANRD